MSSSFLFAPPASPGQDQHRLDRASLCCILCCSIDLIERVSVNESVERQAALPVQLDEPWNELSRVAVALTRSDQANASTGSSTFAWGQLEWGKPEVFVRAFRVLHTLAVPVDGVGDAATKPRSITCRASRAASSRFAQSRLFA